MRTSRPSKGSLRSRGQAVQQVELWVIVAPCVISQAFHELIKGGVPQLDPFPPADHHAPAATVLSMASSERVRRAGIRLIVEEQALQAGISGIQRAWTTPDPSHLRAFEDSVRGRLQSVIQSSLPEAAWTFDAAVADWGPDVVVAIDPRTRRRYSQDFAVMYPSQWVRHAITLSRAT